MNAGITGKTSDPIPGSGEINITVGEGKIVNIAVAHFGDRPVVTTRREPTPSSEECALPINANIGAYSVSGDWPVGGEAKYVVTP